MYSLTPCEPVNDCCGNNSDDSNDSNDSYCTPPIVPRFIAEPRRNKSGFGKLIKERNVTALRNMVTQDRLLKHLYRSLKGNIADIKFLLDNELATLSLILNVVLTNNDTNSVKYILQNYSVDLKYLQEEGFSCLFNSHPVGTPPHHHLPNIKIVKMLIEQGCHLDRDLFYDFNDFDANINYPDYYNDMERYFVDWINLLIEQGVDLNNTNALSRASACCRADVVKLLVDHGVDIHTADDEALCVCGEMQQFCNSKDWTISRYQIIKLLLEHGANVNAGHGQALISSIKYGTYEEVKLLIEHGADMQHCNNVTNILIPDDVDKLIGVLTDANISTKCIVGLLSTRYLTTPFHNIGPGEIASIRTQ